MSYLSNQFALVLLATCRDILPIAAIIIGFQISLKLIYQRGNICVIKIVLLVIHLYL